MWGWVDSVQNVHVCCVINYFSNFCEKHAKYREILYWTTWACNLLRDAYLLPLSCRSVMRDTEKSWVELVKHGIWGQ